MHFGLSGIVRGAKNVKVLSRAANDLKKLEGGVQTGG
jgi:hypothetical protein